MNKLNYVDTDFIFYFPLHRSKCCEWCTDLRSNRTL